jgi:hypothetical protein
MLHFACRVNSRVQGRVCSELSQASTGTALFSYVFLGCLPVCLPPSTCDCPYRVQGNGEALGDEAQRQLFLLAAAAKVPPSTFLNGVKKIGRGNRRPRSAKARKCRLQADSEGQWDADWPWTECEDSGGTTAFQC